MLSIYQLRSLLRVWCAAHATFQLLFPRTIELVPLIPTHLPKASRGSLRRMPSSAHFLTSLSEALLSCLTFQVLDRQADRGFATSQLCCTDEDGTIVHTNISTLFYGTKCTSKKGGNAPRATDEKRILILRKPHIELQSTDAKVCTYFLFLYLFSTSVLIFSTFA